MVQNATGLPHNGVLNNGILDPLQGYDANVWTQSMCDAGKPRLIGRYTSAVLTVRNATEAYMELDQRVPRYLDGEIQIAYVLERGLIDTAALAEAMGYSRISRAGRINRSPRISITFSLDAGGEKFTALDAGAWGSGRGGNGAFYNYPRGGGLDEACDQPVLGTGEGEGDLRSVIGRIKLLNCKIDSFNLAMTGGRGVVPMQIQGVAEGYEYVEGTGPTISGGSADGQNLSTYFGI